MLVPKVYGDDPCIGVHLRQLLFDGAEPLPSLTLDDFDNRVFAAISPLGIILYFFISEDIKSTFLLRF